MAKRKKKRIASRGSVNNIILKTLVNGDKYGYEIIKEVEKYSEGNIILKQPSLYSSLSRFEEKGFVSSYWGDSDIGGRRHYYHLTPTGLQYYNVNVLKIKDDEEIEDNEAEEIIEQYTEEKEDIKENDTVTLIEVSENEIPAIASFENKNALDENIPDHNFNITTPIEREEKQNVIEEKLFSKAWINLIEKTKANNKRCSQSIYKSLHIKNKTKPQTKVILDKDGIYKLRDADYIPHNNSINKPKIVDNVGKRILASQDFDAIYSGKTSIKKDTELTDEEKQMRNKLFTEKFTQLSESKMKPVAPPPQPIQSKPIADKEKDFDYRSKLDILLNNSTFEEKKTDEYEQMSENNLFNYVENDNTDDEAFIDFESEDFETKSENTQYVEEISDYSTYQKDLKINRYENKSLKFDNENKSYVLINKVRCLFGIIMLILFMIELTSMLVIFKKNDLIFEQDNIVFITSFIVCTIISLSLIIPIFINSQDHKLNTYKLKYSLILGILTFFVLLILIYCINSLMGFELDNFRYFAVKLIIPGVLSFNFVIAPVIYHFIINSKRFYD